MALTKETAIDQITISEKGHVMYREVTRIIEDGVQLTQTFHRETLPPDSNLANVPANVAAICNVAWTPEVVSAFKAQEQANLSKNQSAPPTPVALPTE